MLKEEYKDIPDNEFVPLKEGIDNRFIGLYEINKLGQIRGKQGTQKILSIGKKENLSYPKITLSAKKFRKSYYIHLLLSSNFLEPDKEYPIGTKLETDHIDRNKWNFSLNNLRIVSKAENTLNRSKRNIDSEYVISKYDLSWTLIEEISSIELSKSELDMITRSIINEVPYNGFLWKKEYRKIKDYYSNFSKEELDSEEWQPSISLAGFEVSSLGVIRKLIKNNYYIYSIGTPDDIGYRVTKDSNNHRCPIHRLVAEVFLNNGKPIPSNLVIDHLNGKKFMNNASNLKIVTQKENMNNPTTRQKLSKEIFSIFY